MTRDLHIARQRCREFNERGDRAFLIIDYAGYYVSNDPHWIPFGNAWQLVEYYHPAITTLSGRWCFAAPDAYQ